MLWMRRATIRRTWMLIVLLVPAGLAAPAALAAQDAAAPPEARPEDVASPDAIIAAVYDVISGPAGQARDWDRVLGQMSPMNYKRNLLTAA